LQRERRYEPRERNRIQALERAIARDRATREAEDRDRAEMRARLDIWDDDESDELFYTDRVRWRTQRARRLTAEEAADNEMRAFEAREAENLRRESEAFLARQMDELQALAEEQRKAGMLLDDGAPVRLNVSLAPSAPKADAGSLKDKAPAPAVFGAEEEEEEATRKRKVPLQMLDFSAANDSGKAKERLEHIKDSVPSEREMLFRAKVRWDAVTEVRPISLTLPSHLFTYGCGSN
jgi:RNA-binding protein 25